MIQISVVGHEGAGKDTVADMLHTLINDSVRYQHAAALKTITAKLLGISVDDLEDAKRVGLDFWMDVYKQPVIRTLHIEKTAREWLIYVSEEILKPVFGKDIWANAYTAWLQSQPPSVKAVIKSDDRYPAEFDFVNTIYIYVDRPGVTGDTTTPYWENINTLKHLCEVNTGYRQTIVNDGTLADLFENVERLALSLAVQQTEG